MPDDTVAILVSHVSKTFHVPSLLPWRPSTPTEALRDVSFRCPEARITCLLGPNGSGKTTIVKILAGLIAPDTGAATVHGVSLQGESAALRAGIGLASSSERSFYWRLTGRQNLDFFASLHGVTGPARARRVRETLAMTALEPQADTPVRMYSSGMRQRLLIARALLGAPRVLLLDEPTTHLDHGARRSLHRLVREELVGRGGMSVLLCTNDLQEAQELGEFLVLLRQGAVIAEGSLASLRARLDAGPDLSQIFDRAMGDNG